MTDLELIQNTPSDELYKNHLKVVFDTYYKLFGEVCTGCTNKISGYINRIKNYKKSNIMSESKKEFQLKKGTIIPIAGTSKAYSDANITDKIAIELLKRNPNRKVLFSKLPENVDELISSESSEETPTTVKIGDKEFSLEDALAVLKANEVSTRATTISGVQKKVDEAEKAGAVLTLPSEGSEE